MSRTMDAARSCFERLPRAELGFFPTPLYKLERLSADLGVELYIKRDDFTGANLFGGNKIRKLEYLLGEAKARGCTHAVTYGATQSNHAMETAACCRRLGIEPILYLTALVPPEEGDLRANLLLDRILGAEVHIVDLLPGESEDDADARAAELGAARARELGAARARELEASGHPCANIPMGGATVLGSVGFARGYAELREQLAEREIRADFIFHATGTGGTMAGLHAGRALLGGTEQIVSVAVSPKDEAAYLRRVEALGNGALELLGARERIDPAALRLELGYFHPGYEQPNAASSAAIRLLARREGLFVDPVYTGKAFAALLGAVRGGQIAPGQTAIFWHTGGATALFAEREMLGELY